MSSINVTMGGGAVFTAPYPRDHLAEYMTKLRADAVAMGPLSCDHGSVAIPRRYTNDGITAEASPLAPPVLAAPAGNATCLHCGGPAYAGLVGAECLRATGCGPAPLPMPDTLTHCAAATEHMARRLGVPQGEPLWTADGRGCTTRHPVEAEALRLWQAAVARTSLAGMRIDYDAERTAADPANVVWFNVTTESR